MTIAELAKSLDITEEEAKQMLADDEEVDRMKPAEVNNDLTEEQKAVAKKARQSDRKKTGPIKRERKPNEDKRHLIQCLFDLVDNLPGRSADAVVLNPEREIELYYNGIKYKLTLSQPRT